MSLLKRLVIFIGTPLLLAGCLHVQLLGSIAGARIAIVDLRGPQQSLVDGTSLDDAAAAARFPNQWDSFNAVVKAFFLGLVFLEDTAALEENALYLVTAIGGMETDLNRDLRVDDSPTPVSHALRAIMNGAQAAGAGFKVSALTEAAYRWVQADLATLSDTELLAQLDAAALELVTDTNRDGTVDYADILFWTRLGKPKASFLGDFDLLNEFSNALVLGSSDSELDRMAAQLFLPAEAPYWRQMVKDLKDGTYASEDFLYAQVPDADFCEPGETSQAARDRQLAALNRIRRLHLLPPVQYSLLYDDNVQASSLIQRALGGLTHFPDPDTHACFTEGGAAAAASGNLAGASGPRDPAEEMIGFVDDANNLGSLAAAGHRRFSLNPFLAYTSYGQVDGFSTQKVFGFDDEPDILPAIDVDYVALPFGDYPYLFMTRNGANSTPWSFTVVEDRQNIWSNQHDYFSEASVTVTRMADGAQLAVTDRYSDTRGIGVPNFLSWQVPDWELDTRYRVEIGNVGMLSGELRDFRYEVFIDYADLVDLTEPLEYGDRQVANRVEGSLTDSDDRDSYVVDLSGEIRFVGQSEFVNQAFFVAVYGPDKQLIDARDEAFSLNLPEGSYTVVISSCHENFCYSHSNARSYRVTFQ